MRPGCLLAVLVLLMSLSAHAAPGKPTVVSLDYCADQFVLALADREQILAVSSDAGRDFSHFRSRAEGLRRVRSVAEDVLALGPDLVVRSWGGDRRSLDLLERSGIRTVTTPPAGDLAAGRAALLAFAGEIGQSDRAIELLGNLPEPFDRQDTDGAVYVTPGGVSAGRGTIIDAIITHAGLENANQGSGWTSLPMESLVLDPPELVLAAFFSFGRDARDHWSVSRHPVMRTLLASARLVRLDEARISCGAWYAAEEAARIVTALEPSP